MEIKIRKSNNGIDHKEIKWSQEEYHQFVKRILNLRDDQISALAGGLLVSFNRKDLSNIVLEIRKNKENSINLQPILFEASSKEKVFWWLNYFENANQKSDLFK